MKNKELKVGNAVVAIKGDYKDIYGEITELKSNTYCINYGSEYGIIELDKEDVIAFYGLLVRAE